jgi:hypothetical protein
MTRWKYTPATTVVTVPEHWTSGPYTIIREGHNVTAWYEESKIGTYKHRDSAKEAVRQHKQQRRTTAAPSGE